MTSKVADLSEVASELRAGERDPGAYVTTLCDRIDKVDPVARAFVTECDRRDRLSDAVEGVREAFSGEHERPALYGVPIGVKDIVHVDGLPTRAGTALPPNLFAGPEASVVTRLRDAGGLVLGKTVTTEFAGMAPGQTRNPHAVERTPGGSSSGSAAAVAAGMAPLAIGTQTGGSVIRPAAFCGIVGFKPSLDRIPTDGVITRSETIDTVGLFTRDVRGVQRAAATVCDEWDRAGNLHRPVLGVPDGPYLDRASDAALAAFRDQIETLEAAGYEVRRASAFRDVERVDRWHDQLTAGEFAREHADWYPEYRPFYRTVTEDKIRDGQDVTDKQLERARAGCETVREEVHERMDEAYVDLWITPAAPGPAPEGIADTGSNAMNRQWTYAGLPAVTLPAGEVDGLPVGLQCVGRFGADERLLWWAESIDATLEYSD